MRIIHLCWQIPFSVSKLKPLPRNIKKDATLSLMKNLFSKIKMPGSKSKQKNKNRKSSTSNSETNPENSESAGIPEKKLPDELPQESIDAKENGDTLPAIAAPAKQNAKEADEPCEVEDACALSVTEETSAVDNADQEKDKQETDMAMKTNAEVDTSTVNPEEIVKDEPTLEREENG